MKKKTLYSSCIPILCKKNYTKENLLRKSKGIAAAKKTHCERGRHLLQFSKYHLISSTALQQ
jgi:hypothetical protein